MVRCWAVGNKVVLMISVTEMKMLRWMCEVIRENRIRNEYIRGNVEVA